MASISSENRIPIKKLPIAATPVLFGVILLYIIMEWGRKVFNVLTSQFSNYTNTSHHQKAIDYSGLYQKLKLPSFREETEISIGRDEVETVLAKLGLEISSHPEPGREKRLSSKDFSGLFGGGEEEEGSGFEVDEVKGAFDVFDENNDGFIEEKELQRVLCALGLKEGFELENCRNMMRMFDQDGDGKIDFHEFCALF
ncbi:PREDICTED: probable calcium-binding protein CML45 [Ipomoea nil]|uniref:probable calcium-binding protein CML45 n=1 Tax=Ipomoea nil TaxID=35883 RepID=UPI0009013A02|nr:PREDICTED: probable calcium-binding protein CML45 [Ipomoea nil]XP_019157019.1 PREDICTED: probable calcium-binding protein CML45 [Ipomoea nil]